tara:strand:+ start:22 stop:807 length:786 start_codon:yes stop_codon:yes gene_type:complete
MADTALSEATDKQVNQAKQEIFEYVKTRLGDGMIEVELDPKHIENAFVTAVDKFRQRSSNSVEESYGFLELQEDQTEYQLPAEVISVRQIYRRTVGGASSSEGGSTFDPFELAYTNVYLLQTGRIGGLATYDMFAGYQELVARMFGGFINFKYDQPTRRLQIFRRQRSRETVLIEQYNHRPDFILLQDIYAKPWIRDYTLAISKFTLGEARSKFTTIAGPQGGGQLNGDSLKAEAQQELQALEQQIGNYAEGGTPLSFRIG